jgi:hypothetical protein
MNSLLCYFWRSSSAANFDMPVVIKSEKALVKGLEKLIENN